MKKNHKKLDELYLVLIVVVIAILISIYDYGDNPSPVEAEKISQLITGYNEFSFATGGVVDETKLKTIKDMDYKSLKQVLNAKEDFCVYILDEQNNLILEKGPEEQNKQGINCKE